MRTQKNDPLLAFWQYGLGTSMAFTSDAQPKWARPWMGWPDFSAFWSQSVRSTLRQASTNRIQIATHREAGRGIIDIDAADPVGNPLNGLPLEVKVMSPDGKPSDVAVRQTGPGKYEGGFEAGNPGGYIVSAVERSPGGPPRITRAGFAIAYPPEYQSVHPNINLLAQIAQTTGGKALLSPVDGFRPIANPGRSSTEMWPALLLMSAILMVLDIALRRLVIPYEEIWQSLLRAMPFLSRLRRTPQRKSARATFQSAPASPFSSAGRLPASTAGTRQRSGGSLPDGSMGKAIPPAPSGNEPDDPDQPPTPARPAPPQTTAEKLLAAKRNREGGGPKT